jgi:FixJ family two-component response regulator
MAEAPVYLVDADPAVRDSLSTLMDLNGFEVRSFSTGGAFLRSLDDVLIRCVICEAQLPDTTGVQIFESLQRIEREVPFALLVSQRDSSTIRIARAAGITRIFQKPLVHRHLLSFVHAS